MVSWPTLNKLQKVCKHPISPFKVRAYWPSVTALTTLTTRYLNDFYEGWQGATGTRKPQMRKWFNRFTVIDRHANTLTSAVCELETENKWLRAEVAGQRRIILRLIGEIKDRDKSTDILTKQPAA